MPELRRDPIIDRWVIISTERAKRPIKRLPTIEEQEEKVVCPFCGGNEKFAPNEIFAVSSYYREKDTPGWDVRVVPNKFPALQIEGNLNKRGIGLYDVMNGIGAHEVIIETPEHNLHMANMTVEHIMKILYVYRERIKDLKNDVRLRYVLIFKNHGKEAGATISHAHSQLVALPILPKRVKEEMDGAKRYYEYRDRCIYCDIIAQEMYSQERIIIDERNYIALAPFAPRKPFETWIIPKKHTSHFMNISDVEIRSLAEVLLEILKKLNISLSNPPYNFIIHTADLQNPENDYYHWHIEIMPILTTNAGFEWGSGFYINPTPPEEAVKFLKNVSL
jgi:UDPglucose--hexose-1-phosphate uridylyltransferase